MMGWPIAGSAVFAFFPMLSKSLISPLLLVTASLPDSVVAAAEKSFLDAYCLYSESTSLLPDRRGSILKIPLCDVPMKVCCCVVCAYLLSGMKLFTDKFSDTFHSSMTLPVVRSSLYSELGFIGSDSTIVMS